MIFAQPAPESESKQWFASAEKLIEREAHRIVRTYVIGARGNNRAAISISRAVLTDMLDLYSLDGEEK